MTDVAALLALLTLLAEYIERGRRDLPDRTVSTEAARADRARGRTP